MLRICAGALLGGVMVTISALPAMAAGDAIAGKSKTVPCQPCHGVDGQSKLPIAPNLSGQPVDYLLKALTDYKTGARQNEMMSLVVPNLSDQDIEDLAAWYASIEVEVTVPK